MEGYRKKESVGNLSLHLPVETNSRKRCRRCSENKKQTRTKTICQGCDIALCKNCFALHHY